LTAYRGSVRIRTSERESARDVTSRVREIVEASRIRKGICVVASDHTTAGVFVNENADPDVIRDLLGALRRVVPDDGPYRHAEGNSPAHIKAILVGSSVTVPIDDGDLALGRWQGIFFADFDGPRDRAATVTVIGEARD